MPQPPPYVPSNIPAPPAAAPYPPLSAPIKVDWSDFSARLNINPKFLPFLDLIRTVTTVLLCDDSGSMQSRADPDTNSPMTRWEELRQAVSIAIDAHATAGCSCDIYFINRPEVFRGVTSWAQVASVFAYGPNGYTNTVSTLQRIALDHLHPDKTAVRPVLIHIFTDGHPTNAYGNQDIDGLSNWLAARPCIDQSYVSVVLCTDEEEVDAIYRQFEWNPACGNIGIKNTDLTEDFRGEQRDVYRTRGSDYPFSFGDYVIKILVGALDPGIHLIDLPSGVYTKRAAAGGGGRGVANYTSGSSQSSDCCCSIS